MTAEDIKKVLEEFVDEEGQFDIDKASEALEELIKESLGDSMESDKEDKEDKPDPFKKSCLNMINRGAIKMIEINYDIPGKVELISELKEILAEWIK